jgi:O-antigen/teichoic acid export membrane protein
MNNSQLSKFLRNNLIILILVNSASVFNYLFQMLIGRSLTPMDYGVFNSLLSLGAIAASPVTVVHIVFSRFIVKLSLSGLGQVKKLLMSSFRVVIYISIGSFCLGLLLVPWIKNYLHLQDSAPVVFMLVSVSVSLLFPLLFAMLEGLHRFSLFGFGSVGYALTRFLGALILVTLLGLGVKGAFLALIIASGVAMIYGFWGLNDLFKVKQEDLPPNLFGEMRRYSLPVFVSTLFIMVLGNLDIVLVRHYCSPEEAGLYSTAAIIGRIAFTLNGTLLTVLFPTAAQAHSVGEEKKYILWVSFGLTVLLGGAIALVFYFWPEQIISLLFGEKYQEAAPLLQIVGISMVLLASANVIFSYQLARSEYSYLWVLAGGVTLMMGMVLFFHETAMNIAKILLLSTGTMLIGALFLLFFFRPRLPDYRLNSDSAHLES